MNSDISDTIPATVIIAGAVTSVSAMWIQVRTFDGKKSLRVDNLSKLTKIEELRERLVDQFDAPLESQRLFYRGKQVTSCLFLDLRK